ncbi:MAG: ABC transporter substrate-binding protein [Fimbriimonadaceae bacterium]
MRTTQITLAFLAVLAVAGCGEKPKAEDKALTVGFSQIGAESAWRTANTDSIRSEADKRNIDLKFSDAQGKQENQIKAIRSFIAQGVDVIAFAPIVETGWKDVLEEAKAAGIPVFVSDRRPDVPDDLYVTFIGSDFVEEGRRAAQWLADKTGGKAVIAELVGQPGSAPANDRKKGFEEVLAKYPDMKIVFSQTGQFERAKGKEVMEAFLKNPLSKQVTAVFAHNDDMAIGAIQAMEEAGMKPGEDIVIVSIDAIKDALVAITEGKLNASIECNPLLGPFLFDAIADFRAGKTLPKRTVITDLQFDSTNAAAALPDRKY